MKVQLGNDILRSDIDAATGFVALQTGDVTAGTGTDQPGEVVAQGSDLWQHVGFCSRPATPVAGKSAAQALEIERGDFNVCVATRDSRSASMYGALKDGETAVFASTGQARALFKADGSITLVTTSDNTAAGTTVSLRVSKDGFVFSAPWGGFSFTATGFQAYTQTTGVSPTFLGSLEVRNDGNCVFTGKGTICNTSQVLLGLGATLATPCLAGPSGAAGKPSTSVFVGL
jgi:hypothetical protein